MKEYEVKIQNGTVSHTLTKWKTQMMESLVRIYPDKSEDKISDILDKLIEQRFTDAYVTCDNNYTHETTGQGLLKVLDWVSTYKPIIAGNGTFYENQDNAINPTGQMVQMLLKERAELKSQMFNIDDPESYQYKTLDNKQGNKKRSANSAYGGSGAKTSALYSKWSAPATTGTAQSVISTCESTIEAFLGNNYLFINVSECIGWMNYIRSCNIKPDKWLTHVTKQDLFDRITSMFLDYDKKYDSIIIKYINSCNDDEVDILFYKNNIDKFIINNPYIIETYRKVFDNLNIRSEVSNINEIPSKFIVDNNLVNQSDSVIIKKYNESVEVDQFLNPNKIPSTIKTEMEILIENFKKYVYVDRIIVDKIMRLKNFKREVVRIVDTDSCIIQMDTITNLLKEYVISKDNTNTVEQNEFVAVNSMTAILTVIIADILYKYTGLTNICEDYRKLFAMKNEFLFTRLIIGTKKKRYMSLIKVREGNLMKKAKADCKGNDYMKSGTSVAAFKVFDDIVTNDMLLSPKIDVKHIRQRLSDFSQQIYDAIQQGDTEFLPLLKINEFGAYKEPYKQQQIRGAIMWNQLYPDKALEFPVSASALKLLIVNPEDISDLQYRDPDIYDKLIKLFDHEMVTKISKSGKRENRGLGILMIPQNEKIPDWCKPYIDYETIINSIICKFKSVTNMLKIKNIYVGKKIGNADRKSQKLSNIVGF